MKLAGLAARVSTSYTSQRVMSLFQDRDNARSALVDVHTRNAERVARTLGELKGAVMKVGQMVSAQADLLPKEFADILSSLQQDAPPVEFEAIEAQIEHELGHPPGRLFRRFEREPFASASIGQVHRATTDDGLEVVVKVQYPGVEQNMASDLKNLRTVLTTGGVMGLRPGQLTGVFQEIRARLTEELDYCREADNVRRFRTLYADDPEVVVPDVIGERSSGRVITLEFIDSDRIDTVVSEYTQEERNRIGAALERMYARQIFEHRLLHADPHPGNYGFFRDGRIALFDYGCVKEVSENICEAYLDLVRCGMGADYRGVDEAMKRLGARLPDKPYPGDEIYEEFADAFIEPCRDRVAYDFGRSRIHERLATLGLKHITKVVHFTPPREVIFIDRVVAGLYGTLKKLRAEAVWREVLFPHLGLDLDHPIRVRRLWASY